jgi:ubiquinone/menaquinone biosynthesis C-methylase UbiE
MKHSADHSEHHSHQHGGPDAPGTMSHDHSGGMPHRFDNADEWAKVFDDPARDAWQKPDELVKLLAISPGMTVADIGAGTGYLLSRLSAATGTAGRVIGIDLEPDMVRYMKQRAAVEKLLNVEAIVTAAGSPGLADNSTDRIVIVDVWHHLPDRVAYAKLLAKALRTGGTVSIVDFEMDAPVGPPPAMRLSAQQIVDDLKSADFAAKIVAESLSYQYVVTGTVKK